MTEVAVRDRGERAPLAAVNTTGYVPALQTPAVDSWTAVVGEVAKLASHIADTEFVPDAMRGKPAAVAAAILAGREAGIGPMTALQHINIVKGKPGQSAHLQRMLVLAAGHEIRYVETTDTRCVIEGRRRGEQEWTRVVFTADQAKKAGIQLGGYPEDKLVARATTRLCRRKFADATGGMPYSVEELEDGDFDRPSVTAEPVATVPDLPRRTAQRKARPRAVEPVAEPVVSSEPVTTDGPPLPGEDGYDEDGPRDDVVTDAQLRKLHTVFSALGVTERDDRLSVAARIVRRDLASSKDLTKTEAGTVIEVLESASDREGLEALLDAVATADPVTGEMAQ